MRAKSLRRVALVLALLCSGILAGCSLKHMAIPTDVPHTIIFVQGPVDTVSHIVHLYWFGTEEHGYISGYEVRLLNPDAPADTNWAFTTHTDSVLTVQTPSGFTSAVFEARAIDEHGMRDPDPARQTFHFRNQPPIVLLVGKPNAADHSDTTFASATVTWSVNDPDGDASKVFFRIWLDGNQNTPNIVGGTSFTVPSNQFLVNGAITSGLRTLRIQGIDDGGMAGAIDSVTWYVKRAVVGSRARLLLIDDVPTTYSAKVRVDTLYANAVANTGIAPDSRTTLHLQFDQPFRSAKDLEQTFEMFESVVWYHGEQTAPSAVMSQYGDGIGPYLDHGGKLFIESLNLIETSQNNGALSLDFVNQYLNSDGVFLYPLAPDSSSAWSLSGAAVFPCPGVGDSVLNSRIIGGLRAFKTRDNSQILVLARPGVLSEGNPFPMAVALSVPQPGGGLMIADSYPMVSATIPATGFPQRASVVLLKILGLLGLSGP